MGINMLLAAQNFNNIRNSSFAQAVTLIPTRILLKSSPEAALSVLGSGNNGSVEITRIGEGLINTNYGELNSGGGNNYFKSFLLDNDDLKPLLESIGSEVDARKLTRPYVKFIDAAQPAVFAKNHELFTKLVTPNYSTSFVKNGIDCYLGETYLISNDSHFSFAWKINGRQVAQNILITGNEREHSIQAVFSTLSSLSYSIPEGKFRVNFLNALDPDFSSDLGLDALASAYGLYDFETYEEGQLELLIQQLAYLLEQRRHTTDRSPVITYLVGFEKLVKLHKADYIDAQLSEQLKILMSTGSSYGLYFVLEINKPSNLDKVSRDLLGFIEHRICFALNVDESNYLLASKAATKLIDLDAPNIRNKAIYYSLSDGDISKFKSYNALEKDVAFVRELHSKLESNIVLTHLPSSAGQAVTLKENVVSSNDGLNYSDDEKALFSNISIDDL